MLRVDRVDAMLERRLLRRRPTRPIIQTRPTDAKQVRLYAERECMSFPLDECPTLRPRQGRDQISF